MPKLVLVIEDEIDLAEMIKMRLEKEHYKVEIAFSGEDGLAKAKELNPDLLVLDIKLPKMDGYRVCELLKTDEHYQNIPIIMLTARTTSIEQLAGYAAGADKYILKPYDGEKLINSIKELIE